MADWRGAAANLVSGYEVGRASGGRMSSIGARIKEVANHLKSQRETGEQLNILGQTEAIKSQYKDWSPKTKEEALEFERAKTGIQAESPKVIANQKRQNLVDSTKIREEFINRPEVKEYTTASTQVKGMENLLKVSNNKDKKNMLAIDQALITMYNKMTDPNSVVRESEYARTPQNMPLFNRIEGAISKIQKGGAGLTDADRRAIVEGAKILADTRGNTYNQTLQEYKDLSNAYGIEESLITRGVNPHKAYFEEQKSDNIVTIQDITGKTIQIPRQEAIKRGYING